MSSDGKKPKAFTLLYDVSDIERKLSGLLAKTKSADILISEMEKETQDRAKRLSVNLFPLEADKSCEDQIPAEKIPKPSTEFIFASTEERLTNPSLPSFQTALSEKTSDNRLIQIDRLLLST